MTDLYDTPKAHVSTGSVPGAVALVARGDRVEAQAVGSVDVEALDSWNVPGRYGWVGDTGTAAHLTPSTGAVSILLTQLEMTGPTPPAMMRDFWRYAAST